MIKTRTDRWFPLFAAGIIGLFFYSCQTTTPSELKQFAEKADSLSVETAYDVKIRYTDSAILKATIEAPVMTNHPTAADPYMEMPEGLKANFYDKTGAKESFLSANYGINYTEKRLIQLRSDVLVINEKGEELHSEELFWDQAKQKIYTNKMVKIIRDGETIRGQGLESNENFTKYRILKPVGQVKVKDQEVL